MPENTALHADSPDHGLGYQNPKRVAQYVGNQAVLRENGETSALATLYQHTFVGNKTELARLLAPLLQEIQNVTAPFYLTLNTLTHSIALSHVSDGYLLCDANFLHNRFSSPQIMLDDVSQVVDRLWQRFPTSVTMRGALSLNINVHCAPDEVTKRLTERSQISQGNIAAQVCENITHYADLMATLGQTAERDALQYLLSDVSWGQQR